MATTVFRVEKKENFTIISNRHLQDNSLSLKAKGLLTIMLSLPPNWDMTLKGLVALSADGPDAIRSAIAELERHGYLSRTRERNALGQLQCTEYTIHEEPSAACQNSQPEPDGEPKQKEPAAEKPRDTAVSSQIGKSDLAQMGKPNIGKPCAGKPDTIKYLMNQKTERIKDSLSYPHHPDSTNQEPCRMDEMRKAETLQKERAAYEAMLKENIDYDELMENPDEAFRDFVRLALDVMLDAVTTTAPVVRVKGQDFPAEAVKSRLLRLSSRQIDYVWESLQNSARKISKMQSYLLTALYNSLNGEDLYYTQWVKEDFAAAQGG